MNEFTRFSPRRRKGKIHNKPNLNGLALAALPNQMNKFLNLRPPKWLAAWRSGVGRVGR
jgi:hypothetical protein